MEKKKNRRKRIGLIFIVILIIAISIPFIINVYVIQTSQADIIKEVHSDQEVSVANDEGLKLKGLNADCILVLGAGLKPDGTPNSMLEDRLIVALSLYQDGVAPKLLLSGDHGQKDYDEVNAMKKYMLNHGVPSEDIFLDHAGFSTYESMYRAKDIFEINTVIVVTQKYHEYRSLYIAKKLGYQAYGVSSDPGTYGGQEFREIREIIARNKDFFKLLIKPHPTYLGEAIPISGNALESWD